MDDTIVINAGLSEVDKDLVRFLFKLKASTLEHADEPVGVYSVARRIIEAAQKVIDFMNEFSRKDSFFYIFIGNEKEENLKLICSTVIEKSEKTKYFAIKIHDSWLDFSVSQLTLSGKMLTKIK